MIPCGILRIFFFVRGRNIVVYVSRESLLLMFLSFSHNKSTVGSIEGCAVTTCANCYCILWLCIFVGLMSLKMVNWLCSPVWITYDIFCSYFGIFIADGKEYLLQYNILGIILLMQTKWRKVNHFLFILNLCFEVKPEN